MLTCLPIGASAQSTTLSSLDKTYEFAQNRTFEDVMGDMTFPGYTDLDVSRTLLGRTPIVGSNAFGTR